MAFLYPLIVWVLWHLVTKKSCLNSVRQISLCYLLMWTTQKNCGHSWGAPLQMPWALPVASSWMCEIPHTSMSSHLVSPRAGIVSLGSLCGCRTASALVAEKGLLLHLLSSGSSQEGATSGSPSSQAAWSSQNDASVLTPCLPQLLWELMETSAVAARSWADPYWSLPKTIYAFSLSSSSSAKWTYKPKGCQHVS